MSKALFFVGTLVRITNHRNFAYGRIAMVTKGGKQQTTVRFADLPKLNEEERGNPTGFVQAFNNGDLTAIPSPPLAAKYLLITVQEQNGNQTYSHDCLAHGKADQEAELIADAVAQHWYPDGWWDANNEAWSFDTIGSLTTFVEHHREISMAEYINLAEILSDRTRT